MHWKLHKIITVIDKWCIILWMRYVIAHISLDFRSSGVQTRMDCNVTLIAVYRRFSHRLFTVLQSHMRETQRCENSPFNNGENGQNGRNVQQRHSIAQISTDFDTHSRLCEREIPSCGRFKCTN